MSGWRRFVRGTPELKAGGVLLAVAGVGFALLAFWGSSAVPAGSGDVFTARGYASAVVAIILLGVLATGAVLTVLGALLWLWQRVRGSD